MAHHYSSALWPEAEHRCLLRAALLDGTAAVTAFHEWRERIVFDDLDQSSFRLLPLLRWNLNRLGVQDPLLPRLDSVSRFLLVETTMKLDAMRKMLLVFQQAGIPGLLLKGAAIGQRYYPHPSLRPMADCDVLIPHGQRLRALEKLRAAGWRTVSDDTTVHHHSADMWCPPFNTIQVELHWLSGIQATRRDDREAWKAARLLMFRGVPCRTFCAEDEIIHACRHGFSWIPDAPPMRWLADCALIVRRSIAEIDWNKLAERARAAEETLTVRRSLEWIRREAGVRVPADAVKKLRAQRTRRRERRIYVLKAKPRDWATSARLFAEFLSREIPRWRWPLHPLRVLRYFAEQFALPDHGDIVRYFVYRFWQQARSRDRKRLEFRLAELSKKLGARRISSTLLRADFNGLLEEPSTLCWARRKVKLEGFAYARDGSARPPLRVTKNGAVLPSVKYEPVRVDIAASHPQQPNALASGFSIIIDLPAEDSRFFIEYHDSDSDEWRPLFAVQVDEFQIMDGVIFPEKFPRPPPRIEFGNAMDKQFLLSGWAEPEPPSRWSDGHKAEMIFGIDKVAAMNLDMKMWPFLVPEKVPAQTAVVSLNGQKISALNLSDPAPAVYSIQLPPALLKRNNTLAFELPQAASPASLRMNPDTRKLGIRVEWMEIRIP